MNKLRYEKYGNWTSFWNKPFDCPDTDLEYYTTEGELPPICADCYKGLIYLKHPQSAQLRKMLNKMPLATNGKYNGQVVVFYLTSEEETLELLNILNQKIKEFDIIGYTQWRRGCKEYQVNRPEWWRNAKEFIGGG